jgi:hypothetical protein
MRPNLSKPLPGRSGWRASQRIRLALLLSCCLALALWLAAARTGALSHATARVPLCPGADAPHVVQVSAAELGELRASVARALPDRIGRLYEEGAVDGFDFWSDDSPSPPPTIAATPRSGGYELRWWAPNRDDVVADVLLFDTPAHAREFLLRAASPGCRPAARAANARWPSGARNLRWINPDGFAQADTMFARGARVYRVAIVQTGRAARTPTPVDLRRAFRFIDTLACLLPAAACEIAGGFTSV